MTHAIKDKTKARVFYYEFTNEGLIIPDVEIRSTHRPRVEERDDVPEGFFKRFEPEAVELKKNPTPVYPIEGNTKAYTIKFSESARSIARVYIKVSSCDAQNIIFHVDIPDYAEGMLAIEADTVCKQAIYVCAHVHQGASLELDMSSVSLEGHQSGEHHLAYYAWVDKDGSFIENTVSLGGPVFGAGAVDLNEEGASAFTNIAAFVESDTKPRFSSDIRHHKPHTTSAIVNHGVVGGTGKGQFTARGYIDKGAHGASCNQESRFITLSPEAQAFSYPVLVIDEYDVVAGHASSVGQLDEEALFYMQSRGLDEKSAQQVMTQGFLKPIIEGIGFSDMRLRLEEILDMKVKR